jgi:NAD(P)-dependent dehydrogenase (short-subunit alcohol dehydrogenase family)
LASFFAWSLLVNLFLYKIRSIIKTSIDPASVFRKNSMSKPVAIITGAASGIGLSLTRHLLSSGWRVAMADRNEEKGRALEKELGPDVMFMTVDVSKYDQQAALFQSAFEWGNGRLDFLAANAGIDDHQSLYEGVSNTLGPPPELNTDCIQVHISGFYHTMHAVTKCPAGRWLSLVREPESTRWKQTRNIQW